MEDNTTEGKNTNNTKTVVINFQDVFSVIISDTIFLTSYKNILTGFIGEGIE